MFVIHRNDHRIYGRRERHFATSFLTEPDLLGTARAKVGRSRKIVRDWRRRRDLLSRTGRRFLIIYDHLSTVLIRGSICIRKLIANINYRRGRVQRWIRYRHVRG